MTSVAQLNAALSGRYEIERQIGRGGMATVYLARDLRHHRHVALKLLDPELGAVLGADRFLSEIRVTANLQHPNLLPLFDSGEAEGLLFYVMPFVDGETLRARIDRDKQLPVAEAVRIATAIASALDYAHRHGVIHRDLKPENILLQEDQPLIADFGIALAVSKAGGARVTQTGLSLGTPQYMSPEQATGDRGIDGRTDIYSLGALTYEMLSGEPPHAGTTAQAIIARLMTEEPRPLTASRRAVPEHVDSAVRCALEKLPADRFQTAKEFGDALNGRVAAPARAATPAALRAGQNRASAGKWLAALGAAAAIAAALGWLAASRAQPAPMPVRFEVDMPPEQTLVHTAGIPIAVSPDGRRIAYLASAGGRRLVHVRSLGDWQARALPGTEDGWEPRFSPDGRRILFEGEGQPRTIAIDGGAPVSLPPVSTWVGYSWGNSETIVLSSGRGHKLNAVDPKGGTPRVIFATDSGPGAPFLTNPFVLPGGKVIAFMWGEAAGPRLATIPLSGGTPTRFDLEFDHAIGYDNGWLIFGPGDGTVAAVEMSPDGRKIGDRVVPLLEGVSAESPRRVTAAMSRSGTLAYLESDRGGRMVFLDRSGAITGRGTHARSFQDPQFSPDGKRVAVTLRPGGGPEVWVLEIATNTLSRLADGLRPAWTPDGKRIVYLDDSTRRVFSIPADASGPPEQITEQSFIEVQVAPDGKHLVVRGGTSREGPSATKADIFLVSLGGERKVVPLLATPASEANPRISPDGRWLAYMSSESNDLEIYVRPLMGGARTQISQGGGAQPVWAPDGKRIYYIESGVLYSADVLASPSSLAVVRRDSLFSVDFAGDATTHQTYDISPDGTRFVGIARGADLELKVVVNWLTEVRAKLK